MKATPPVQYRSAKLQNVVDEWCIVCYCMTGCSGWLCWRHTTSKRLVETQRRRRFWCQCYVRLSWTDASRASDDLCWQWLAFRHDTRQSRLPALAKDWYADRLISARLSSCLAPCGLRGCKSRPAPFPDRMS